MTRLASALLFVNDVARLSRFYVDALGLVPVPAASSDGYAVLDAGGVHVALHAIPAHIAADIAITTPPAAREETPLKLIFAVTSLDETCARVVAHGGVVLPELNGSARDVLDPEGNVIQLTVG